MNSFVRFIRQLMIIPAGIYIYEFAPQLLGGLVVFMALGYLGPRREKHYD